MIQDQNFAQLVTPANDDNSMAPEAVEPRAESEQAQVLSLVISEEMETGKNGWTANDFLRKSRYNNLVYPALVSLAASFLNLAHALRFNQEPPDVSEFRSTIIAALTRYERDLEKARIAAEHAQAAHYIICATIDDVVLSTAWGMQAGWAQTSLVTTFHMSVTGGERVFELLDNFRSDPETNKELLLLIYLCLSLAFEGRMRVATDGSLQLIQIRHSLYKTLMRQHVSDTSELSPHWRGSIAPHKPVRSGATIWTAFAFLITFCLVAYLSFGFLTEWMSGDLRAKLNNLPIWQSASIVLSKPAPPPQLPVIVPQPAPSVPVISKADRIHDFRAFLQPDTDKRLVTVTNDGEQLILRINNAGLFATGSAEINQQFHALLQRIGNALTAEDFHALIIGYTDNVPIRTVQFPSNQHLSAARARAVGDILAIYTGPSAIRTEGRGDSEPLADNKTAEGRQINRRIEMIVSTRPEANDETTSNPLLKPEISAPSTTEGRPK